VRQWGRQWRSRGGAKKKITFQKMSHNFKDTSQNLAQKIKTNTKT
jgi:hypothetical protein